MRGGTGPFGLPLLDGTDEKREDTIVCTYDGLSPSAAEQEFFGSLFGLLGGSLGGFVGALGCSGAGPGAGGACGTGLGILGYSAGEVLAEAYLEWVYSMSGPVMDQEGVERFMEYYGPAHNQHPF
jgi:hypothetical protein